MEQYNITKQGPANYRLLTLLINTPYGLEEDKAFALGLLEGLATNNLIDWTDPTQDVILGPHYTGQGILWGESKYDLRATTLALYLERNDVRAALLSGIAKLGAGAGKMLGTAFGTFISSTVGTLYGIGLGAYEAATAEEGKKWDAFWTGAIQNDVSKSMNNMIKGMENIMPNYYSTYEQNMSNWLKLGTMNFWADGILKNMGFTIGAAAAGMLWGAAGSAIGLSALGGSSLASVLAKGAIGSVGEATIEAINATDELEKTRYQNIDLNSARLEQEALMLFYNDLTNMPFEEAQKLYLSRKIEIGSLNQELKLNQDAIDANTAAGNAVFGWNVALLTLTNSFELSALFKGGADLSKLIAKQKIKAMEKLLGRQLTKDELAAAFRAGTLEYSIEAMKNPALSMAGRTLATGISEGVLEEGGLNLISNTEQVYATSKWKDTPLASYIDLSHVEDVKSKANALSTAFKDLYGSAGAPGWLEVMMGFIGGIIGAPFIGRRSNGKLGITWIGGAKNAYDETYGQDKQAQEILNKLNSVISDDLFINRFYSVVGMAQSLDEYMDALRRGDISAMKLEELRTIAEQVNIFESLGKIEDLKAIYEGIAKGNLTDEDIETLKQVTTPENGTSPLASMTSDEIKLLYKEKAQTTLEKIEIYRKAIQLADDFMLSDLIKKLFEDYDPSFIQNFTGKVAFELANKDELQRRLDKVDLQISLLDHEGLTTEQINLLINLKADKKDIERLLSKTKDFEYYKNNPTEFKQLFDLWVTAVNKMAIGRVASEATNNLLQAQTVADVIDAFRFIDSQIKDLVVKEVKRLASPELKALIKLYEDFLDDYIILLDLITNELNILNFGTSETSYLNLIVEGARNLVLLDDSPALTRESLSDKIDLIIGILKADNPGMEPQLDLVGNALKDRLKSILKMLAAPQTTTTTQTTTPTQLTKTPTTTTLLPVTYTAIELLYLEDYSKLTPVEVFHKVEAFYKDIENKKPSLKEQTAEEGGALQYFYNRVEKTMTQLKLTKEELTKNLINRFENVNNGQAFSYEEAVKMGLGLAEYYFAKQPQTTNNTQTIPETNPAPKQQPKLPKLSGLMSGTSFTGNEVNNNGKPTDYLNPWLEALGIDLQSIRDKYLPFIPQGTKLHFIKHKFEDVEVKGLHYSKSNMILLAAEVTPELETKLDKNDSNTLNALVELKDKKYLIIGNYGWEKYQANTALWSQKEQLYRAYYNTVNDKFTGVSNDSTDNWEIIDWTTNLELFNYGNLVTQTKNGEPLPNKDLQTLAASSQTNPLGIDLSKALFLVYGNDLQLWLTGGATWEQVIATTDLKGAVKNLTSGNVYLLVPTVNGNLLPIRITPTKYSEALTKNNEAFNTILNKAVKDLAEATTDIDALTALEQLQRVILFKEGDKISYANGQIQVINPNTGDVRYLTLIKLGDTNNEEAIKLLLIATDPMINVEHLLLESNPEVYLGTNPESCLLTTDVRKLAAEGVKFEVNAVDENGLLIIPEHVPAPTNTKGLGNINRSTTRVLVSEGVTYRLGSDNNWYDINGNEITGQQLNDLVELQQSIDNGKLYEFLFTTTAKTPEFAKYLKYNNLIWAIQSKGYVKLDPTSLDYYEVNLKIAKLEIEKSPTKQVETSTNKNLGMPEKLEDRITINSTTSGKGDLIVFGNSKFTQYPEDTNNTREGFHYYTREVKDLRFTQIMFFGKKGTYPRGGGFTITFWRVLTPNEISSIEKYLWTYPGNFNEIVKELDNIMLDITVKPITPITILPTNEFELLVASCKVNYGFIFSNSPLAKRLLTRVAEQTKVMPKNSKWDFRNVKVNDILTTLLELDATSQAVLELTTAETADKINNKINELGGKLKLLENLAEVMPDLDLNKQFSKEDLISILENYLNCH